MLIRHLTSLPSPSGHSLAIFLVPTVALVTQVTQVLTTQTSLRITSFVGSMGVEYWKREQWLEQLDKADVVVLTAQIWLNVLANAYWNLERASSFSACLMFVLTCELDRSR
jgi:endoribonuclease Dicer